MIASKPVLRETSEREERWIAADPSLLPALRHGYQSGPGWTRVQTLRHGLDSRWRIVSSMQSADSLRDGSGTRWAFSAHLLASDKRWAVAVMWDNAWYRRDENNPRQSLERMLEQAVVEDNVAGLVRRFTSGKRLPVAGLSSPRGAQTYQVQAPLPWPSTARLDVLAYLLMEQDFEGKAAEAMLVDLAFGAGAIERHRRDVEVAVARQKVQREVLTGFTALAEHASSSGILTRDHVRQRAEMNLRRILADRFCDEITTSLDETSMQAVEQVYRDYFGEVLDEVRASHTTRRLT